MIDCSSVNKLDVQVMKGLLRETVIEIREIINESIHQNNRDIQDFVRHEVRSEVGRAKEEIIEGVAQLLDNSIPSPA